MTTTNVRLHVLAAGSMTTDLGGFLEGESGAFTFPVPVYVIEHPDALVVVDAGLHPDLATDTARLRHLDNMFQPHLPADGSGSVGPVLTAAGFDPAEVDVAVLTHLHFDHCGGMVQLPNARIVVQGREWAELSDEGQVSLGSYNPDDVDLGHDRTELDGDHDLFGDATVVCLLTDGHTAGHQSLRVQTESGTYVICGDCCYLRRSLADEHLPPFAHDADRQLASMRRVAGERALGATLLYGHDPEQWAVIQRDGLHPGV